MTPLHYACRTGARQIINMLLRTGVDVNAKVGIEVGCTAFTILVNFGARRTQETPEKLLELVQELVARDADIHARDADGNTVMHHACYAKNHAIQRSLRPCWISGPIWGLQMVEQKHHFMPWLEAIPSTGNLPPSNHELKVSDENSSMSRCLFMSGLPLRSWCSRHPQQEPP